MSTIFLRIVRGHIEERFVRWGSRTLVRCSLFRLTTFVLHDAITWPGRFGSSDAGLFPLSQDMVSLSISVTLRAFAKQCFIYVCIYIYYKKENKFIFHKHVDRYIYIYTINKTFARLYCVCFFEFFLICTLELSSPPMLPTESWSRWSRPMRPASNPACPCCCSGGIAIYIYTYRSKVSMQRWYERF
jgi:hypothetical protein